MDVIYSGLEAKKNEMLKAHFKDNRDGNVIKEKWLYDLDGFRNLGKPQGVGFRFESTGLDLVEEAVRSMTNESTGS